MRNVKKILVLGSGPTTIGQPLHAGAVLGSFIKTLKSQGFSVVYVDNTSTSVTDHLTPEDRFYIEPLSPAVIQDICVKEECDALVAPAAGKNALEIMHYLSEENFFQKNGVALLGMSEEALPWSVSRRRFKELADETGLKQLAGETVRNMELGVEAASKLTLPVILKPSLTSAGQGSAIAYNVDELEKLLELALNASPAKEVLVEKARPDCAEVECVAACDARGNVQVLGLVEYAQPLGIHPENKIAFAGNVIIPQDIAAEIEMQTTQLLRAGRFAGGLSTIKYAFDQKEGALYPLAANTYPDSAALFLASALGIDPGVLIAKLATGETLENILTSDAAKTVPFSANTHGYCAARLPAFSFENFPEISPVLSTSVKSFAQSIVFGRKLPAIVYKALALERAYELDHRELSKDELKRQLSQPMPRRLGQCYWALHKLMTPDEISALSGVSNVVLNAMREIVELENSITRVKKLSDISPKALAKAKMLGFTNDKIASITSSSVDEVEKTLDAEGIKPVFARAGSGPFWIDWSDTSPESTKTGNTSNTLDTTPVCILGPEYLTVGRSWEYVLGLTTLVSSLTEMDVVSTVFTADLATLLLNMQECANVVVEPAYLENIDAVADGAGIRKMYVRFLGKETTPAIEKLHHKNIDFADKTLLNKNVFAAPSVISKAKRAGLRIPPTHKIRDADEAQAQLPSLTYPVIVNISSETDPFYCEIVYDSGGMEALLRRFPHQQMTITRFFDESVEVDVDVLWDGADCVLCGISEHVKGPGIHSGDSASALPPRSLSPLMIDSIREQSKNFAASLEHTGLINLHFAVHDNTVYLLTLNFDFSRTIYFLSKIYGLPLKKISHKLTLGKTLKDFPELQNLSAPVCAVRDLAFPFAHYSKVDILPGPLMRSTGDCIAVEADFGMAYAKAQIGLYGKLPLGGTVFISLKDSDKTTSIVSVAHKLKRLGFELIATDGTAKYLTEQDVDIREIKKVSVGRPNVIDLIKNAEIALVINTPSGKNPRKDETLIRSHARNHNIPILSTVREAVACVQGLESLSAHPLAARAVNTYW